MLEVKAVTEGHGGEMRGVTEHVLSRSWRGPFCGSYFENDPQLEENSWSPLYEVEI